MLATVRTVSMVSISMVRTPSTPVREREGGRERKKESKRGREREGERERER
jgi:hypothetical protein